ncbi:hypothetical protein HY489_03090 [Candidatus Woesearchaeota archaeon]|nr:hypothetical protein [Candidatus Woesearchaeota archaeon]
MNEVRHQEFRSYLTRSNDREARQGHKYSSSYPLLAFQDAQSRVTPPGILGHHMLSAGEWAELIEAPGEITATQEMFAVDTNGRYARPGQKVVIIPHGTGFYRTGREFANKTEIDSFVNGLIDGNRVDGNEVQVLNPGEYLDLRVKDVLTEHGRTKPYAVVLPFADALRTPSDALSVSQLCESLYACARVGTVDVARKLFESLNASRKYQFTHYVENALWRSDMKLVALAPYFVTVSRNPDRFMIPTLAMERFTDMHDAHFLVMSDYTPVFSTPQVGLLARATSATRRFVAGLVNSRQARSERTERTAVVVKRLEREQKKVGECGVKFKGSIDETVKAVEKWECAVCEDVFADSPDEGLSREPTLSGPLLVHSECGGLNAVDLRLNYRELDAVVRTMQKNAIPFSPLQLSNSLERLDDIVRELGLEKEVRHELG